MLISLFLLFLYKIYIEILLIWIIISHKKNFLLRRHKSYIPHLFETPKTRLGRPDTVSEYMGDYIAKIW